MTYAGIFGAYKIHLCDLTPGTLW